MDFIDKHFEFIGGLVTMLVTAIVARIKEKRALRKKGLLIDKVYIPPAHPRL